TRCLSDWSSDVCSSDLRPRSTNDVARGSVMRAALVQLPLGNARRNTTYPSAAVAAGCHVTVTRYLRNPSQAPCAPMPEGGGRDRSEERRVGKEGRAGAW